MYTRKLFIFIQCEGLRSVTIIQRKIYVGWYKLLFISLVILINFNKAIRFTTRFLISYIPYTQLHS